MLREQADNFISDYASSEHFLFLEGKLKDSAESVLQAFFKQAEEQGVTSLEDLRARQVEEILLGPMARLDLPAELKKGIPLILDGFFTYLDRSGRFPPAAAWQMCVEAVSERFRQGIREDGTAKGETFKKKYTDVGRNEPCPCGSGQKFKKCCMTLIR